MASQMYRYWGMCGRGRAQSADLVVHSPRNLVHLTDSSSGKRFACTRSFFGAFGGDSLATMGAFGWAFLIVTYVGHPLAGLALVQDPPKRAKWPKKCIVCACKSGALFHSSLFGPHGIWAGFGGRVFLGVFDNDPKEEMVGVRFVRWHPSHFDFSRLDLGI